MKEEALVASECCHTNLLQKISKCIQIRKVVPVNNVIITQAILKIFIKGQETLSHTVIFREVLTQYWTVIKIQS